MKRKINEGGIKGGSGGKDIRNWDWGEDGRNVREDVEEGRGKRGDVFWGGMWD